MTTCKTCEYAGRPIYKSPCSECKGFSKYEKQQTNADRIRAMSDEELAAFLAEIECRRSIFGGGAVWKSVAAVYAWLKQPDETMQE